MIHSRREGGLCGLGLWRRRVLVQEGLGPATSWLLRGTPEKQAHSKEVNEENTASSWRHGLHPYIPLANQQD